MAAIVGLYRRAGDDGIGTRRQRVGEGEFEHPRLVAAEGQARQVVAFDMQHRAFEMDGQARHGFQRGGRTEVSGTRGSLAMALFDDGDLYACLLGLVRCPGLLDQPQVLAAIARVGQ